MPITRRGLMGATMLAAGLRSLPAFAAPVDRGRIVDGRANWVEGRSPTAHAGQTFGMAWPRGRVSARQRWAVRDDAGRPLPAQSWITATWPDGSVKWTAHALPADTAPGAAVMVGPGRAALPDAPVRP